MHVEAAAVADHAAAVKAKAAVRVCVRHAAVVREGLAAGAARFGPVGGAAVSSQPFVTA
jgi:hypothetical protein